MTKKAEAKVFTLAARGEFLDQVEKHWPEFKRVPDDDKWPVAMWVMGSPVEQISRETSLTEVTITKMVKQYENVVMTIPHNVRARLDALMIWKSIGALVSIATDADKLKKLSPIEATRLIKDQMPLIKEFLDVSEDMENRGKQGGLDFDRFGKTLNQG